MAAKPANAKQRKWMSDIANWANENIHMLYTGGYAQDGVFQLHHVTGRSSKHNKVAIGHWFIIPVPFDLHDISSNNQYNVTHNKYMFTERFGKQSEIFAMMLSEMNLDGYSIPPDDVYNAIMDTGK
tara:strand:+ start:2367 stop:2744 length:378 start_codon:yes stop_codon:yes gene_type:complete